MKNLEKASLMSDDIKLLAVKATKALSSAQLAYRIARRRTICSVDYMRYAEFDAILRDLDVKPQMTILDVSSPQWLSLYLANKYPNTEFRYINIIDSELDPFKEIAQALGINNLKYHKADVRDMEFQDNIFDRVISVSVIEHIYPEEGGDLKALSEIKRVLKPEGQFLLTVPYKSESNIVYMDGPVHERGKRKKNFYAREYDEDMFNALIQESGLSPAGSWFICERKGNFSIDYYEWGPGKDVFFMRYLLKSRRLFERIIGRSLDEALAKRYLSVSREITGRLVNVSATLSKV